MQDNPSTIYYRFGLFTNFNIIHFSLLSDLILFTSLFVMIWVKTTIKHIKKMGLLVSSLRLYLPSSQLRRLGVSICMFESHHLELVPKPASICQPLSTMIPLAVRTISGASRKRKQKWVEVVRGERLLSGPGAGTERGPVQLVQDPGHPPISRSTSAERHTWISAHSHNASVY